jgi:putative serine protease PepD
MTEYEANPHQPGKPEPGSPDQTADLPPQEARPAAASGDAERSESAAPPTPAPAGQYAPPPDPWAPPAPAGPSAAAAPPPSAPPAGYPSPWQQQPTYSPQSGWQQPTSGVPGSGAPGYPPHPAAAANQPPPTWAPPPGGDGPTTVVTPMGAPAGPGMYRQPSHAGRRLAAGVAVLALAVGSGVLGAWVALQADDEPTTTTLGSGSSTTNRNSEPAPVINRDDLANVAAAVQPSVVSIRTESNGGSGVVYDDQGNIVTNNHVVAAADGGSVTVTFSDGKNAVARVVSTDPRTDLAVVRVSDVAGLTPSKIGDSGAMRVGDAVIALGSPLGLEGTVTAGIISALDRTIQVGGEEDQNPFQQQQGQVQSISGLLQTDAPINPGNSGGALANTKGEVIGINTAIPSSSTGNIGVGFAIPSNKVKAVADQLIKGEKVKHPFLGVSVADGTNGGAVVRTVTPNSPAAKAGIQPGDVVTKLGDKVIGDQDDLVSAVQSGNVGDQLEITYTRNGEQKTATVTLADAS